MNKQNRKSGGFQKSKFKPTNSFKKKSPAVPRPKGSTMMDQFKPKMPMAGI